MMKNAFSRYDTSRSQKNLLWLLVFRCFFLYSKVSRTSKSVIILMCK